MKAPHFSRSCLDESIRPQDDLYHYAMGGWLKKNPVPPTENKWGTFYMLRKSVLSDLHSVIETVNKKRGATPAEKLVQNLYRSVLDEVQREKAGVRPIAGVLKTIKELKTGHDVERFVAEAHLAGYDVLWTPYVGRDDKRSMWNTFHLAQAGLSLPDRDYYVNADPESKRIRAAYSVFIPRLLALAGFAKRDRERMRDTVIRVETLLAQASMTRVEMRDPHAIYNRRSVSQLSREAAPFVWTTYLKRIGAGKVQKMTVCQPHFIQAAARLLSELPVQDWQDYFAWKVVDGAAPYLTKALVKETFRFYGTVLSGTKKMRPLWERAVAAVNGSLGDAVGKLYVQKHFTPKTKKSMDVLVDNLFTATRNRIKKLSWMSEETKKRALYKLSRMSRKIGYPIKWESYKGLSMRPNDYWGNVERAHAYGFKKMMHRIDKPYESWRWHMSASTVNAYFDPNANEIAFPAGILQPPFFDPSADDALNYGAIGAVIGHEITHAFDDEGRQFDAKGNLHDWWTTEDAKRFNERADILRKQYDAFVAIDDVHVNGSLTLGENIADLGGVVIAYDAFMESQKGKKEEMIDGFTREQRFFMGLSLFEASNYHKETLKQMVVIDPHSPSVFRVNGPVVHADCFYDAFGVKEKDKLYLAPEKRVHIW